MSLLGNATVIWIGHEIPKVAESIQPVVEDNNIIVGIGDCVLRGIAIVVCAALYKDAFVKNSRISKGSEIVPVYHICKSVEDSKATHESIIMYIQGREEKWITRWTTMLRGNELSTAELRKILAKKGARPEFAAGKCHEWEMSVLTLRARLRSTMHASISQPKEIASLSASHSYRHKK